MFIFLHGTPSLCSATAACAALAHALSPRQSHEPNQNGTTSVLGPALLLDILQCLTICALLQHRPGRQKGVNHVSTLLHEAVGGQEGPTQTCCLAFG
eukprot:9050622-Lingulodinium_polyedra.AAC.1